MQADSGQVARAAAALSAASQPVEIVGAVGGFSGFVLAAIRQHLPRTLVVVTPDDERAQEIRLALEFFEPGSDLFEPVQPFWPLDHSPYSGMSPSRLRVMERVATLFRLAHDLEVACVVVPARALIDRVMPAQALLERAWLLAPGERLDRDALLRFLADTGYHPVPAVEDPGTFALRGGIIDVFSPLFEYPLRIELWGDEIDTLRLFDPTTQRTLRSVDTVMLGPARDIVFDAESVQRARLAIRDLADELHVPSSRARALVDDLEAGILAVGMEELLPAFWPALDTLWGVAPADTVWLVDEPERCEEAMLARWEEVRHASERVRSEGGELAFVAERLYVPAPEAIAALNARTRGRLVAFSSLDRPDAVSLRFDVEDNADVRRAIEEATQKGDEHVLSPLTRRVRAWREAGHAVVVCAHSEGSAERLRGLLAHYGLSVQRRDEPFHLGLVPELAAAASELALFVGDPGHGFRAPELRLVLLDETEILGRKMRRRHRRHAQVAPEAAVASWRDLREGDYVVHLEHGIGCYRGLEKTAVSGIEVDFLVIEYADRNKLFVPVDKLHLVSKHTDAEGQAPSIDKLGGSAWQRKATRVRKAVRNIADRLLRIYAERELREGHAFAPPGEYFARFEADFPWDETPDQARAIEDVLADMQRPRPMDRLVCGDVGFGKTEVALRAAFLAVLDGRQVAVLVPTVVLAEQHRLTFERRLREWPVRIANLTRTLSAQQIRETREALAHGEIDIVIGTHRILSKDVEIPRLGLVIVDEEHRFGVAQKETLKGIRPDVDMLTLTATPIPRTLHLAMTSLRDISLIQTPPVDRLAIRTVTAQPNERVITDAIRFELSRGGQVFFVHNRVEDIHKKAELIRALVPEARIGVGHGQMDATALEDVMLRFMRGETNVLVCTTIIESGLDIPNANTILIDRADRFGLAQLYQLRGRVGRSSVRAHCYLLIPSPKALSGDAAQRIAALQRFTELGSGFNIASHDLDIRGTGDILGADQAGHIDTIGYDAYMELLREAVEERRATTEEEQRALRRVDPDLKVAVEARIPESWLPETTLRLRFYKQLAGAATVEEVYAAYRDSVDRYGRAPLTVSNLVDLMALKLEAKALGLASVGYNRSHIALQLTEGGALNNVALTRLLTRPGNRWRATREMQLLREVSQPEWDRGLATLRDALREIADFAKPQAPH
ncbi:MAG: transcription-repair coupling factor [Deltaproteobacteria bacterium]|nr:transcription-repair coupling factor [Deltaproteobacteria bacterium]